VNSFSFKTVKARSVLFMATLETLPPEIKDHIFSYLPQRSLYPLTLVCSALVASATIHLYRAPTLLSSYRFANFVTTISHSRPHADMVREFHLPDNLRDNAQVQTHYARRVGWKYKDIPLSAPRPAPGSLFKCDDSIDYLTHPGRNQFLMCGVGTVAVGSVIQVLAACRTLRSRFYFSNS